MKGLLLVDGYNVIHQSKRYSGQGFDLEGSRSKLLEDLASYGAISNLEVMVVFDGAEVWSKSDADEGSPGVKVIFTKKSQTADSLIEKLTHALEPSKQIIVVTADYAEQKAVFGKGALRKTPKELIAEINSMELEFSISQSLPKTRNFIEDALDEETLKKLRKLT